MTWTPTHRIILADGREYHVMLTDDGGAYTESEWRDDALPSFALIEGEWQFCGDAFDGFVTKVTG